MLIPFRDVIPSRIRPWGTLAFLVLMAAAFVADQAGARPTVATGLVASPGWVAFVANVMAVWILGETVEGRMGHLRFLLFAGGATIAGSLTPQWLGRAPLADSMGASAAAGAIAAAYFVLYRGSRVLVLAWFGTIVDAIEVPAFFFAGLWALAQGFHATSPFTDTASALLTCAGGIAWGMGTVWVFRRPVDWRSTPERQRHKSTP